MQGLKVFIYFLIRCPSQRADARCDGQLAGLVAEMTKQWMNACQGSRPSRISLTVDEAGCPHTLVQDWEAASDPACQQAVSVAPKVDIARFRRTVGLLGGVVSEG